MRFFLSLIFAIGAAVFIAVAVPVALIATAFWAAEGSWDFEDGGLKHWIFVQGSRLDRLGTIEPTGSVKFSVRLEEGTFPGWSVATYESAALPEKIISFYGELCMQMKFKITENKQAPLRAEMTCEIERYLDIEILAEREPSAARSKIVVRVWGRE